MRLPHNLEDIVAGARDLLCQPGCRSTLLLQLLTNDAANMYGVVCFHKKRRELF